MRKLIFNHTLSFGGLSQGTYLSFFFVCDKIDDVVVMIKKKTSIQPNLSVFKGSLRVPLTSFEVNILKIIFKKTEGYLCSREIKKN